MTRMMNFNAGPACLPLPVLEEAQAELLDYAGTGMSLLEASHRSPEYDQVHQETQALMKELLGVGDDYHVLFLGGGASSQFAMIPFNFLKPGNHGDNLFNGLSGQCLVSMTYVVLEACLKFFIAQRIIVMATGCIHRFVINLAGGSGDFHGCLKVE